MHKSENVGFHIILSVMVFSSNFFGRPYVAVKSGVIGSQCKGWRLC